METTQNFEINHEKKRWAKSFFEESPETFQKIAIYAMEGARVKIAGLSQELYYHNEAHTFKQVVPVAMAIAESEELEDRARLLVFIAALFHDTGFEQNLNGEVELKNEAIGADNAADFMMAWNNYDDNDNLVFTKDEIELVKNVILATDITYTVSVSDPLIVKILRDADMQHLGGNLFPIAKALRQEILFLQDHPLHDSAKDLDSWHKRQIAFLENFLENGYYTEYARKTWGGGVDENLAALKRNDGKDLLRIESKDIDPTLNDKYHAILDHISGYNLGASRIVLNPGQSEFRASLPGDISYDALAVNNLTVSHFFEEIVLNTRSNNVAYWDIELPGTIELGSDSYVRRIRVAFNPDTGKTENGCKLLFIPEAPQATSWDFIGGAGAESQHSPLVDSDKKIVVDTDEVIVIDCPEALTDNSIENFINEQFTIDIGDCRFDLKVKIPIVIEGRWYHGMLDTPILPDNIPPLSASSSTSLEVSVRLDIQSIFGKLPTDFLNNTIDITGFLNKLMTGANLEVKSGVDPRTRELAALILVALFRFYQARGIEVSSNNRSGSRANPLLPANSYT